MALEDRKSPPELIEGIDYYLEAGRCVFTAAYLLGRGSCCGSGCRHCPYHHPATSENNPDGTLTAK